MKNKKILFLSRHGESEYNVKKLLGGDSNLTNNGIIYSKKIFELFKNKYESKGLNIWTSCLKRTIQTAQYFDKTTQFKELNEINSGICEHMTYQEVKEKYPEVYSDRSKDKYNYKYPEGESYQDIHNRLNIVYQKIKKSEKDILIICHQAVLRVLYSYFFDIGKDEIPYLEIPLNTIFKIYYNEVINKYVMQKINIQLDKTD